MHSNGDHDNYNEVNIVVMMTKDNDKYFFYDNDKNEDE